MRAGSRPDCDTTRTPRQPGEAGCFSRDRGALGPSLFVQSGLASTPAGLGESEHIKPTTREIRLSLGGAPIEPRVLRVERSSAPCGGSFRLNKPAAITHQEPLAAGWVAELVGGSRQIVVHGPTAIDDYRDAVYEAHAAAQEALDLMTMRAVGDLVIEGADSGHIVWWLAGGVVFARIVGISDVGVSASATATVTDKDGNIVPSSAPPALFWHESLRYFRLAQATSDLFDAYRNMYLALEALLSTVVPQRLKPNGKPDELEGAWLMRALQHVHSVLPFGQYAPSGSINPVKDVYGDLYAGTRTALFHAKSGRAVLLPHGRVAQTNVIESLERLSRLFLDLSPSTSASIDRQAG